MLKNYLARLSVGGMVLWFYLIWYLVIVIRYFDPSPALWPSSLGISLIIGTALLINASTSRQSVKTIEFRPAFRVFSHAILRFRFFGVIKGRSFYLIFSPQINDRLVASALCAMLWITRYASRRGAKSLSSVALT